MVVSARIPFDEDGAYRVLELVYGEPEEPSLNGTRTWREILHRFAPFFRLDEFYDGRHHRLGSLLAEDVGRKYQYNQWTGRDCFVFICIMVGILNKNLVKSFLWWMSIDERFAGAIDEVHAFIEENFQEAGESHTESEVREVRHPDGSTQRVFDFTFRE